jgi:hypothetical protein
LKLQRKNKNHLCRLHKNCKNFLVHPFQGGAKNKKKRN